MGPINWLAVVLATLAFFMVGALWYGVLLGKVWQREVGLNEPPRGAAAARTMGLTLLAEFVVVAMLAHLFARAMPPPHVKMMMATGFAGTIMAPALAINYVHQRRSLVLFLIDAGHFLAGMAAAGAMLVWMG